VKIESKTSLGLDAEVLRRALEPKAGEPFDAAKSAQLDQIASVTDQVDALRVIVTRAKTNEGAA
jgi:hypothetical protein